MHGFAHNYSLCLSSFFFLSTPQYGSDEIQSLMDAMRQEECAMHELWQALLSAMEQSRECLQFKKDAEDAEAWLALRDELLASTDKVDSLESAEALLAKLADLEKSMASQ